MSRLWSRGFDLWVLLFCCFWRGCGVCVGARGGGARDGGQACGLPVTLPGGAVEARRSRVPRSGIALATPEAPLSWEGRPRRLRGATAGTHTQHQSFL